MGDSVIKIRGARQHNLKNINVDIPKNKLVVITGLSGSGKSSLAFDTIYAEGQRRYVESLSSYARQFLDLAGKPDVDLIDGLSPAISIEQKTTSKNPRSTVGTVTEIYDYMRLLWSRIGVPYSPATGLPIESQTVTQMTDAVCGMPSGAKIMIEAPIVRGRKGEYKKEIADLQRKGFQRLKIDGEVCDIDNVPELNKNKKHDIAVIIDRLVIKDGIAGRVAASIETALSLSDDSGLVFVDNIDSGEITTFSSKFACPVSGFTIEEIEPRMFSFNNPHGSCPECEGLGVKLHVDPDLIIKDGSMSLNDDVFAPSYLNNSPMFRQVLQALCKKYGGDMDTPFERLPEKLRQAILFGTGDENVLINYDNGYNRASVTNKPFEGLIPNMERRFRETDSDWARYEISLYQSSSPCAVCGGKRLRPEALAVKIDGMDIIEVCDMSIRQAKIWFSGLSGKLDDKKKEISSRILKEIVERLSFLENVGLGYLTLSRSSGTLSGGESQRIRLASQIGSGLTGVLYVLDEPSIGLHQRDNDKLLLTLKRLRDLENTVIVVEHDEDAIRSADHVLDIGPGAGVYGGYVVAQGKPSDIENNPQSVTGQYLSGLRMVKIPAACRKGNGKYIEVKGAHANNLRNVDVKFPLGMFVCVTGVSGSGKSSLVIDTLYRGVYKELNDRHDRIDADKIIGIENIDKVINISQDPIGRTPRSNPATYTGVFNHIRDWFAALPEAKARGYKSSRFSFNVKGGRCEACEGDGVIRIGMNFLPDVYVECEQCKGKRYNRETLEIKYKDKSIADVLDMTVDEAMGFFENNPAVYNRISFLKRVGLGYIRLGQSATTLSGGEAQRIKLSKELSRRSTGRTLYILDEPTTGLHFADVERLLDVLHELVNMGNTVVVIEHNLDVIKTADYIIDIGPEGGDGGGRIVATGSPRKIAKNEKSYTGLYLKKIFAGH